MLNLTLLLEVLMIACLLGLLVSLLLLLDRIVTKALLHKRLFLFAHLFDPIDARLLLQSCRKGLFLGPGVQNCRGLRLRLHKARSMWIITTEIGLGDAALVRVLLVR